MVWRRRFAANVPHSIGNGESHAVGATYTLCADAGRNPATEEPLCDPVARAVRHSKVVTVR